MPITSKAWSKKREQDCKNRKAAGKPEGHLRDIDLRPVVVQENILQAQRARNASWLMPNGAAGGQRRTFASATMTS